VDQGHLSKYIKEDRRKKLESSHQQNNGKAPERAASGDMIHTIHGVLKNTRATNSSLRAGVHLAMMTERSTFSNPDCLVTIKPFARGETPAIIFSDADLIGVALPHFDPLVIKVRIDVQNVERVLVDTGSSTDVIYKNLFQKMKNVTLREISHPIVGWNNQADWPLGITTLNVKLGPMSVPMDFVVMDVETSYNAILGRAWIAAMKIVTSTNHQKLKFICPEGLVTVRGMQSSARDCFRKAVGPTLTEKRPEPITNVDDRLAVATKDDEPPKCKPEEASGSQSSKQPTPVPWMAPYGDARKKRSSRT
jgi:hypothetical protein